MFEGLPVPNVNQLMSQANEAIKSYQSNSPIGIAQDYLTKIRDIDPRIAEELSHYAAQYANGDMSEANRLLASAYEALQKGDYSFFAGMVGHLGGEFEKYIDQRIAQQNTGQNQDWEKEMRDTSLLSTADQLGYLGLSPSNVIQVGGMSHNGVGTAQSIMRSNSALRQQQVMNQYNQRMGLAKSIIGMAGQMASSGIYGGALNAAKNAGAKLAAATAHSGLGALKTLSGRSYADVIEGLNKKM